MAWYSNYRRYRRSSPSYYRQPPAITQSTAISQTQACIRYQLQKHDVLTLVPEGYRNGLHGVYAVYSLNQLQALEHKIQKETK